MFTVILALVVAGCGLSSSITTGPSPAKCAVAVSGGSAVDSAGGTRAVTVTTQPECAWTAAAQASWITELAPVSGQGNGEIRFRVGANPAATPRAGELVVNDTHTRIEQAAAPAPTNAGPTPSPTPSPTCVFAIAPASYAAPSGGGRGPAVTITTGAGCVWTASSNAGWITIVGGASGSGSGTVTYEVAPASGATRTGSITIAGQTFSVTQGSGCTYSLANTSHSVAAGGGAGTAVAVAAASGCAWTATSNVPWITITGGASGSSNGSVTFAVAANTAAARSGTITIAGQTLTISQAAAAAASCSYSISATGRSFDRKKDDGSVMVTAGAGCPWTAAVTRGDSWISITSGASGTGNGMVTYRVDNNNGDRRTGTLLIAGHTFTATQEAKD